jgi:hypothetical protein
VILCEYRNERRWNPSTCLNPAARFMLKLGYPSGRAFAICEHHYEIMSDEALRVWREISREEYEVSKVHES